jgi:hypothetical protein
MMRPIEISQIVLFRLEREREMGGEPSISKITYSIFGRLVESMGKGLSFRTACKSVVFRYGGFFFPSKKKKMSGIESI